MTDWHEQDEFWDAFGGAMFDDAAWEKAEREIEHLTALLDLAPGSRVLDLCCGPGRHAIGLAERGHRVTGVDRTPRFLEACAERTVARALEIELIESDMREFLRPDAFDAVLNLNTSFGYFRDPEDDRRVVRHVFDSLAPGGAFLIEVGGKEVLARIFQARDWRELNGELLLYERRIERDWSWIRNRWIRIVDGERQEYEVGHRLYSGADLVDLLGQVGFDPVRAHGSLDGTPYDERAARLVVVGRKPENS
jgi:SAM-dependent methyltransferase